MFDLARELMHRLTTLQVRVDVCDPETVVLHNVPANQRFYSKSVTKLLVKSPRSAGRFFLFVDQDLEYTGGDSTLRRLFARHARREGWRLLQLGKAPHDNFQRALEDILKVLGSEGAEPVLTPGSPTSDVPQGLLGAFGTDLSGRARADDDMEPTVGREEEIDRAASCVLGWGPKRLAVVAGDPGVGKSNLLGAVARRLSQTDRRVDLVAVDLVRMLAGAWFDADREQQLLVLLEEVSALEDTALALENLELVMQLPSGGLLLTRFLERHIPLIGTTCPVHLPLFERGPLARHVQVVELRELSPAQTVQVLEGVRRKIAEHHRLDIDDAAIPVCVQVAHTCLRGVLPAKALALLDSAASRVSLAGGGVIGPDDVYFAAQGLPGADAV